MDKQHRIQIPKELLKNTTLLNAPDTIRLGFIEEGVFSLFHGNDFPEREYIDVVKLDSKGRFVLKQRIITNFNLENYHKKRIFIKGNEVIIQFTN